MKFLILALLSFSISSLVSAVLSKKAKRNKKIFRTGGIAIISSFIIVLLSSGIVLTSEWKAILIGSLAILFFGILDDFKNFNWKVQLLFQFLLVLILVFSGFEIGSVNFSGNQLFRLDYWDINLLGKSLSLMSGIFIFFWLTGIINAVNWMDGSDGLLSIAGIFSLLTVFLVSLRPEVNQPAFTLVSLIAIGSLAGFLVFNFPKSKIEAGTSGSYFTGFLLASLAIAAGTKISTTMIILILPVIDFIWVIWERLRSKSSVFERDNFRRHLHYKLSEKGLSSRQILLSYFLFLGLALFVSFFVVNQTQKLILLIVEFLMITLSIILSILRITLVMLKLRVGKNFKMKKITKYNPAWILVIIIVVAIIFNFQQKSIEEDFITPKTISINSAKIKVQVAQTPEETYQGLSGIKKIPAGTGMLFLYNQMSHCSHVMRDMEFDLDFVFLKDGEVVEIQKNIPKNSEDIISSPEDCNQVLEINAGETDRLGIKIGDYMSIK